MHTWLITFLFLRCTKNNIFFFFRCAWLWGAGSNFYLKKKKKIGDRDKQSHRVHTIIIEQEGEEERGVINNNLTTNTYTHTYRDEFLWLFSIVFQANEYIHKHTHTGLLCKNSTMDKQRDKCRGIALWRLLLIMSHTIPNKSEII